MEPSLINAQKRVLRRRKEEAQLVKGKAKGSQGAAPAPSLLCGCGSARPCAVDHAGMELACATGRDGRDLAGSPLQPCLAARLLSLQPSLARSPSSVINHPGWMEPRSWKIPEWSASTVPFPSHKVGEGAGVREPVASSFSDLQRFRVGLQVIFLRLSPHIRPPVVHSGPSGGRVGCGDS